MKTICFNVPTIDKVQFEIECEPEDMQIEGNASASGDDKLDKKVCNSIRRQLNNGNEWAWCCVKVTARYKSFEGVDYLGGCSYESENDFKKDGYFEDMKQQAYDNLLQQLEALQD